MMNNIPYVVTDTTCTVYVDGEPFTVDRSTQTFAKQISGWSLSIYCQP